MMADRKLGKIYVLWNPALKDCIIKIGRTSRNSESRAKEISNSTGVPADYEVVYDEDVLDCILAEKTIHKLLSPKRINPKREFFKVPLKEAVKVVFKACLKINNVIKKEAGRRVAVYIDLTKASESSLVKLKKLFPKYRGKTPVFLSLTTKSYKKVEILIGKDLYIKFSPEFLNECKQIKGIRSVEWCSQSVNEDGEYSEKEEVIDWDF